MGIDFDHFKAVNERWGQHARDPMLREAVAIAYAALRSTDALGRTGGEEFPVVVSDAALAEAHALAEPPPAAIAARTVTLAAADGREVMHAQTACIGVHRRPSAWPHRAPPREQRARPAGRHRCDSFAGCL